MKTNNSSVIIVLVLVLVALGFVFYQTSPDELEVTQQVTTLVSEEEITPIKTNLLEQEIVKEIEALRIYGARPVQAAADKLNRRNPFEGL